MPLQGCWVINPGDVGKVPRAGFDLCKLWYVTVSTIIFSFHMPFEGLSGGKDLLHRWDQSRGGPKPEVRTALPAFEYFLRVRGFSPLVNFCQFEVNQLFCSFNKYLSRSIVSNPGVSRVGKTQFLISKKRLLSCVPQNSHPHLSIGPDPREMASISDQRMESPKCLWLNLGDWAWEGMSFRVNSMILESSSISQSKWNGLKTKFKQVSGL